MDLISPGPLLSLAARAVIGAVGAAKTADQSTKVRQVASRLEAVDSDASKFILPALSEFKAQLTPIEIDKISRFLQLPESDVFVRAVAIAVLTREYDRTRDDLRAELLALIVLTQKISTRTANRITSQLFSIIADAIRRAAGEFRDRAPREYGSFTDRALVERNGGYLKTLSARTQIFRKPDMAELADIFKFALLYKSHLHRHTSELVPAYFDVQRRVHIDHIYVVPRFLGSNSYPTDRVTLPQIMTESYRPVILGDPGAGKTTLAQSLGHQYSTPASNSQDGVGIIPFIVSVRQYESRRRQQSLSIAQFIAEYITESYQIPVPTGAIDYLLATGQALVVFDGLDELLDIGRRRDVCTAVESFSELYATTAILATSRTVGYYEAPLQPSIFKVFFLLPFTDDDVAQYAKAWFAIDDRLAINERDRVAEAFLEESLSVQDLRSNALMLGLLCNVYRGVRTIPQNRAELYQQCANMLFERWDAGRGIIKSGLLKADARAALQDVALWIYKTTELTHGVPESLLRRRLTAYWMKRYENPEDAEDAARALLQLWQGRSWILTDVGTSAERKERVFKFTHQTFLEYFAAVQLARTLPSPSKLWRNLKPKVQRGSWDIVAQLSIQKLNESYDDASDEIVRQLIGSAEHMGLSGRLNLISFAARNVENLYVKPSTYRLLAQKATDLCFDGIPSLSVMPIDWDSYLASCLVQDEGKDVEDTFYDSDVEYSFDDPDVGRTFVWNDLSLPLQELYSLDLEQGRLARDEFLDYCAVVMSGSDVVKASKAFLMRFCLPSIRQLNETSVADNQEVFCQSAGSFGLSRRQLTEWSRSNFWVSIVACRMKLLSVADVVQCAGAQALFCGIGPFGEYELPMFADTILRVYLGLRTRSLGGGLPVEPQEVHQALRAVSEQLGDDVPQFDRDWTSRTNLFDEVVQADFHGRPDGLLEEQTSVQTDADLDIVYAVTVLLAVVEELEQWSVIDYSEDQVARLKLGTISKLSPLFISRQMGGFEAEVATALRLSGMSAARVRILQAWADRQVDFIPSWH